MTIQVIEFLGLIITYSLVRVIYPELGELFACVCVSTVLLYLVGGL